MNRTAEKFWSTRTKYPPVVYKSQRRYLDLGLILKHSDRVSSILDLGCGEGQLLLMLRELTNIDYYYAYDLSQKFIDSLIIKWGDFHGLNAKVESLAKSLLKFPKTDVCICMGVMHYMLDYDLSFMLSNIESNLFICKMPCSLNSRVKIDKFSKDYNDNYAAVYRTLPEYVSALSEFFTIKSIGRCYPDKIESKYGTKQFFFICEKEEDKR